jgi:DNA-binding transcriptional MerR regulator
MNIGKAASLSGLTVKTVRYYSDIGIIKPDIHSKTGYRHFSSDDVAKLQFVGKARKFNFGIEECRELLALYENKDRPSKDVKKITLEKIREIDIKLSELNSSERSTI